MIVWLLYFVVFVLSAWFVLRYRNGYWERRGIPFIPATILVGNLLDLCMVKKPMVSLLSEWYNHPAGKNSAVVGIHLFQRPVILVRDLELVKDILVKDFAVFNNR